MRIFERVARFGSFSEAAIDLQLSLSAVSKRVARLEAYLNAILLDRSRRQVALTDAGQQFFKRCVALIRGIEEAVLAVTDSNVAPQGHLRVHALSEIGKRYLIPAIADYSRQYPAVTFELVLDNQIPDLTAGGFDLSVSLTPAVDAGLVSRNLGASYSVLCASRLYLERHGQPTVPEELIRHACLRPLEDPSRCSDSWDFEGPYGEVSLYLPPSAFQLHSSDAIVDAVRSGIGIGCVPAFVAAQYLRDEQLVRVLPDYQLESTGIHVSYPAVSSQQACVRSWVGYLNREFAKLLSATAAAWTGSVRQ